MYILKIHTTNAPLSTHPSVSVLSASKIRSKRMKIELSDTEKKEPYANYYYRKNAMIPPDIINDIQNSPYPFENALQYEKINDLLNPGYLSLENGFCCMPDGSVFVAILTEMTEVTGEMLDWWFWWHPINPLRYKIWYPETHFDTTVDVDLDEYKSRDGPYNKRYWNITNYPIEDIGIGYEGLSC